MKNTLLIIKQIIGDFVFNSFWQAWGVLAIVVVSLALNGVLWYIYETKIKENSLPFIFASGLIILNLILANYLWPREKMAGLILLGVGLFTQLLMLILIRYLTVIF